MQTYSADENLPVGGRLGIIEDLTREIYGEDKPFTWGIRDSETGQFFLMEEDCEEMEDGYEAVFTLNFKGKINRDDWEFTN